MIGQLTGKILSKNPPEILLEVGGIGYEVFCPMSSFYAISGVNILLHTHLHIKDDAHTLYGFTSQDEKTMFRELIRVNGIGPKVALAILSYLSVGALINAISNKDDDLLAKTPGIGKKTAAKLIVELQDRLDKLNLQNTTKPPKIATNPNIQQALQALQALGFRTKEAEKMLSTIADNELSTEELIRLSLKNK